MAARGFSVNPSQVEAYRSYLTSIGGTEWVVNMSGMVVPEYEVLTVTDDVVEPSPDELSAVAPNYIADYASYADAAIAVFGRPGGEGKPYDPANLAAGVHTQTGHILSLTEDEIAI